MIPRISIENVSHFFGDKQALKNVTFDIMPGTKIAIMGSSGGGKSVLLRLIIGLLHPTSGNVKIDGKSLTDSRGKTYKDLMRKFGMLFQGGALFDSMSVWENIGFMMLQQKKINRKEIKKKALVYLEKVGLKNEHADLYPSQLSGGMRHRVALARAIALEPQIVLLDEPTSGLDHIISQTIDNLIIRYCCNPESTLAMVTHDIESAKNIADQLVIMKNGLLIWRGNFDEAKNHDDEYIRSIVGLR